MRALAESWEAVLVDDDERQIAYYEQTAERYDEMHVADGDEHSIALEYVAGLCGTVGADSLLDVGAGTGRAVRFLAARRPDLRLVGLEPVDALRQQAISGGGEYHAGTGESLPFPDDSFDVVLATAVMHHVPQPAVVVGEMLRVARKAVMISDANRYGQGRPGAGAAKLLLRKARLWDAYVRVRTKGAGHFFSEGDGLFYSYSLYDSLPQVAAWATRSFVIPTKGGAGGLTGPLFSAGQGLLVAVREPCFEGWAGTGATDRGRLLAHGDGTND